MGKSVAFFKYRLDARNRFMRRLTKIARAKVREFRAAVSKNRKIISIQGEQGSELRQLVTEWCETNGLDRKWVQRRMESSALTWVANRQSMEKMRWTQPRKARGEMVPEADRRSYLIAAISDPGLRTKAEAKDDYVKAAKAQFEADWEDLVGALPKKEQLKRRQRANLPRNLGWLVQYQVLRMTYATIAKNAGLRSPEERGRRKVSDAVKDVAGILELKLRKTDLSQPRRSPIHRVRRSP